MKFGFCCFVLISCLTVAIAQSTTSQQTTPSQKTNAQKPAGSAAQSDASAQGALTAAKVDVAPDATVITITGLCPAGNGQTTCTKTVTKAAFEKILNARAPDGNLPLQARRGLANEYVQLLTVANEGQKLGVDKDPILEERLELAKTQLIAQSAARKLFEGSKPTHPEIETFYAANSNRFEELQLRRVYLPKPNGADAKPEAAKPATTKADAAKTLADSIRKRLAAGEDPEKLEAEAYTMLKVPGTPPTTSLGWKRHGTIDARYEQQISALQAGQVSEVLDDLQGYSIYKLELKRTVPLNTVEKDIENALQRQRFEEKMKQLLGTAKADFNENYFGSVEPPTSPQPAPAPALRKPTGLPKK